MIDDCQFKKLLLVAKHRNSIEVYIDIKKKISWSYTYKGQTACITFKN